MPKAILGIDIGIRHMSFCELTVDEEGAFSVDRWEVVDLLDGDRQSANKIKMEVLHPKLEAFLSHYFPPDTSAQKFNCVGIELQPYGRLTNLRMHIAANLVYSYFRFVMASNRCHDGKLTSVRFIAAAKKYPAKLLATCGLKPSRAYAGRKKNSVALCRHLTNGLPHRGKIDDMADSFLIARACL
jgi:hypothetical protein